ncbi:hypothetical protein SAMN05892877_105362 [Rhizobium subbaraonis]|uniref:Tail completion protein R (GpR) n=1 Tax=Rhizobium subbaraonis TaxID=908946 RepID=A0A285UAN8_9HYPH|nr:hypothetical protein [Rhizobium subbaraonis]SOC38985.1 hypothetical protein SAMN05892877_105362 [Rhizobium subbaraonis]
MPHRRSLILDAYLARLSAIPEFSAPNKVARGRYAPIPQEFLPALTLTWAEGSETASVRPCSGSNGEDGYDRQLPLSIIVHLRDADADREFDRICVLIEQVMGRAIVIDQVIETTLRSSRLYVDPRTGLPLGAGALNYAVSYKTLAADPTIPAL